MIQNSWVSPLLTHKPQYFVQAKRSGSRWNWQGVAEHIQYGMDGHKPSTHCWESGTAGEIQQQNVQTK